LVNSSFRERIGYATSKGGAIATLLWILKRLGRIEAYRVFALSCVSEVSTANDEPPRFTFRHVLTGRDIGVIGDGVRAQLEDHLGRGLDRLVAEGSTTYFLADNDQVVCQLIIAKRSSIHLDMPTGLVLEIGPKSAFLSYLYTHDRYRRIGAAQQLLHFVSNHLAQSGYERAVTHVSATNVPSLNAFAASKWTRIGTIWTTQHSRRFVARGLSKYGVTVRSEA
jgi:ribosomal protein S18 acetylase RimI-like enzyme